MKTLLCFRISVFYCYSIIILGSQRSKEGWEGTRVRKLPDKGSGMEQFQGRHLNVVQRNEDEKDVLLKKKEQQYDIECFI